VNIPYKQAIRLVAAAVLLCVLVPMARAQPANFIAVKTLSLKQAFATKSDWYDRVSASG
jgi:hypothetical protein